MRLYFIGGASGSGKTAVMPHLKELLGDDIAVYDFEILAYQMVLTKNGAKNPPKSDFKNY